MKRTCCARRSNTDSEPRPVGRAAATATALALLLFAAAPASADTAALWAKNCATCHGADGSGQTPVGKLLKLRDYRDATVQASFDRASMIDATANGVKNDQGKDVMKGFASKLSAAEIEALVDFVLAFGADAAPADATETVPGDGGSE